VILLIDIGISSPVKFKLSKGWCKNMADKDSLPYGTFGRVRGVVDKFAESTTPTSLNTHVLDGISGGDFSALMTSLKFLGLISENQAVKPELRDLVEARKKGEDQYKAAMLKVVKAAYDPIVGKVDVTNGTLPELEKAFKDGGVPQGQMLTKVTRFYVKALEDSGVKVSDYITKPRPPGKKKATNGAAKDKRKPPKPKGDGVDTSKHLPNDPPPQDFARLPIPGIEGGFIQYPKNLTDGDCTMFETMVAVLRTYVKSRKGEGKKP
jgi:hypothetical protein